MSKKVKLIVEIPKYYLKHPQDYSCLAECVRRGVPLDSVKAEIMALRYGSDTYNDETQAFCKLAIEALEQESVLDKIKGYIDHIRNTAMGKKKSLDFIEKYIEGLKTESKG